MAAQAAGPEIDGSFEQMHRSPMQAEPPTASDNKKAGTQKFG